MTIVLSARNAAGNHSSPSRRARRPAEAQERGGPRLSATQEPGQSDEADAEGLAAGDSLGVSDPGGSQSALMAL